MTTIPSDPPLASATPPRTVRSRRAAPAARHRSPLSRTVEDALSTLDGLAGPLDYRTRHSVDRHLRTALNRHVQRAGESGAAVPAVRVACAHLAAGDLEWAYLSLLTARDQLG
jgi:hypothetical protein